MVFILVFLLLLFWIGFFFGCRSWPRRGFQVFVGRRSGRPFQTVCNSERFQMVNQILEHVHFVWRDVMERNGRIRTAIQSLFVEKFKFSIEFGNWKIVKNCLNLFNWIVNVLPEPEIFGHVARN